MSLRGALRHQYQRIVLILVATFTITAGILASSAMPAAAASGPVQGLQVSPVIINLNAEKGQNYTLKVTITNVTAGPLVVNSAINDFKAKDETGNPEVILDNNTPEGTYSLRDWISAVPPFTLASQQSQSLSFVVNVPSNAEAGGHYGVIRFAGTPPSQKGGTVSLNASVGTLILARVEGNITEQLSVKQMFTSQNGKQTGFMSSGPVNIVTRVQNTGNVHLQPVGTLTVKNMWGKNVATYKFGASDENVLPGSIRRYQQVFDKPWLFGKYTASVQAAYGTTGGVLMSSVTFWIIPYKLILFILVILAIIIVLSRRAVHRHDAHVVRKHAKRDA